MENSLRSEGFLHAVEERENFSWLESDDLEFPDDVVKRGVFSDGSSLLEKNAPLDQFPHLFEKPRQTRNSVHLLAKPRLDFAGIFCEPFPNAVLRDFQCPGGYRGKIPVRISWGVDSRENSHEGIDLGHPSGFL